MLKVNKTGNIKVIKSGVAPTLETLPNKGDMAFGAFGGKIRMYGNDGEKLSK